MSFSDFRKKKLLFLFNVFFGEYLSEWRMTDVEKRSCKSQTARDVHFKGKIPVMGRENFD